MSDCILPREQQTVLTAAFRLTPTSQEELLTYAKSSLAYEEALRSIGVGPLTPSLTSRLIKGTEEEVASQVSALRASTEPGSDRLAKRMLAHSEKIMQGVDSARESKAILREKLLFLTRPFLEALQSKSYELVELVKLFKDQTIKDGGLGHAHSETDRVFKFALNEYGTWIREAEHILIDALTADARKKLMVRRAEKRLRNEDKTAARVVDSFGRYITRTE